MLGNGASSDLATLSEYPAATGPGTSDPRAASTLSSSGGIPSAVVEDWWRLLSSERPALPPPLRSLDLSGHEVSAKVVSELADCAGRLGPDCLLSAVRMAQCRLDMGIPGEY